MLPKVRTPETRRMITLEVCRNTKLTPTFSTITLAGTELEHLKPVGFDQTVRLFFPREGQDRLRMPTLSNEAWMAELLLLPKSRRPWVRNYTIRQARPELGEVDIEFALHGDTPASTWARHARPGDPAGIFDMGVSYLPPRHAERQLLVGDESAVPAILAILEHAPASLSADVILEVPTTADIRPDITAPEGARVHWLPRNDASLLPGSLALQAAKDLPLPPPGRFYTWVAGEATLATGLRRHLVRDRGVPKPDIAFQGYWRHGRSSPG
ncbi:siderophore-interacting protein [Streptomyces botrytidirepellens]|uniref:Siderophore-interacting protein n=1 Tax=Streptomyces botrytidirepellens TaxID=2486417 RepID=A0A3M8T2I4_9ACTN|nr:siderophore-interacting protein [Streptomyces botrytidirepellens]RNF87165.1 siderophore-interacting protein [Streptomyces botrytidirepellens]